MDFIDILLLFVIIFVLYFLFKNIVLLKEGNNVVDKEKKDKKEELDENFEEIEDKDYLDELIRINNTKNKKFKINPVFVESQYHNDYRDTITAFSNIAPCYKNVFNVNNIPVDYNVMDLDNISHVKKIIKDFIKEVNKNVLNDIPEYRNANSGWDELIPEKKIKSGWEKQMESLGLPGNLYSEPAKKCKIVLLSIDRVEKYETEDELKYVVYLFIKKKFIKDQLLIKVSFVMNKKSINEEREFFDDIKNEEKEIIIEDIFVIGYMTNSTVDTSGKKPDDFYNFEKMENQNMLDDKVILKELIKKYKDRTKEMGQFSVDVCNEDKIKSGKMPNIMGFNTYQSTQPFIDDVLKERTYS